MPMIPVDTAVVLTVGPLIDDTDFKSLETGVAYNASGMSVDLVKTALTGAGSKTDLTLTTGGSQDWTELGNGIYEIEITAAQNDTEGEIQLVGVADGILPFISAKYQVVPQAVYNSLVAGSDNLQVDAIQIEGSDATDQIRDAVVDDATRIDASALNTASSAIGSNGSGLTEAGGTGDHLTAINLPDQTMNITGDITGNLSGSVGSVTGAVGSVAGNVGGNVTGSVGSVTAGVTLADGAHGGSSASMNLGGGGLALAANSGNPLSITQTGTGDAVAITATSGHGMQVSASGSSKYSVVCVGLSGAAGGIYGSIGSVTGGINTASGTITTLDGLDTAQDSQHSTTQAAIATAQDDLDIITGTDGVNLLSATQASIDAIEADTNELQGDWVNGGRLDLILDELTTQGDTNETKLDTVITDTNELQTDLTDGGRLDLIFDAILVDTNSLNDTKIPQTLNLTASGNIGIDWANVENPTTSVDLSGTDIQLCDTVTTNTDMRGTDSAFLAASAPGNFSSLVISGSGAVDSLVQGFINNTIAESTADNISANFETFFDNGDSLTSTTVDDVGSGGGGGGDATEANQTTIISHLTDIKGATWDSSNSLEAIHDDLAVVDGVADAILLDTAEIGAAGAGLTEAGGDGDHLTAVPWNSAWDTEVQSEVADALTAYDPPTNTEMAAAFTEIKGATWSSSTDTLEAIRDRGDSAWITATGFSTLDAAGIRTAVGLSSANLDTQLGNIPTVSEFEARTLLAAAYFDPSTDTVTLADGAHGGASASLTLSDYSDFTGGGGGDATAANQATIITHLTDIKGATWDSTNSLEAIHDDLAVVDGVVDTIHVDTNELQTDWTDGGRLDTLLDTAASAGAGSGARTVTITVDDGTDPLENAIVRMTEGVNTYRATSNASGIAVFNLDDASYTVAISKSGYSYSGTTLVVNGDETETYSMTAIVFSAPDNADMTLGYFTVYDIAGDPLASESITYKQTSNVSGYGTSFEPDTATLTSDVNGLVQVNLYKGANYAFTRTGSKAFTVTIPDDAGDSYELPNML